MILRKIFMDMPLENIVEDFCKFNQLYRFVDLTLDRGLMIQRDKKKKTLTLAPADKIYFGMAPLTLRAAIVDYEKPSESLDPEIDFEDEGGYSFSLRCSKIQKYGFTKFYLADAD